MKITSFILVALLSAHSAFAGVPSFVLDFEGDEGSEVAYDALGDLTEIRLSNPSHVSKTEARFGSGSLLIKSGVKNATAAWYLSNSSQPELFNATPALTIAAWIKLEANEGGFTLLRRSSKSGEAAGSFSFGVDRRDRLVFDVEGERIRSDAFKVLEEHWFHIAATYDAGTVVLYLDGVEVTRGEVPAKEIAAMVGDGSFSSFLNSQPGNRLDEVVFLGYRALSADEVVRLMEVPLRRDALPALP